MLEVSDCHFNNNLGYFHGGAISAYSRSKLTVAQSIFNTNVGDDGGAIHCNLESICSVYNSSFWKNRAIFNGGAININGNSTFRIEKGYFDENRAIKGGSIYADANIRLDISTSYFYNTYVDYFGGVLYLTARSVAKIDKIFVSNVTAEDGAIFYIQISSVLVVNNSVLTNTIAYKYGGLAYLDSGSSLSIIKSNISNMKSVIEAGSVAAIDGFFTLDSCVVKSSSSRKYYDRMDFFFYYSI